MSHHRPRSILSLIAAFLLVGGCDNPDAAKLTGHYSLESATSAQWTNGTNWSGSYTNGPGGEITMRLNDIRFTGEYVVDDDVLTTTLSADFSGSEPSPFGTLVWKRNPES